MITFIVKSSITPIKSLQVTVLFFPMFFRFLLIFLFCFFITVNAVGCHKDRPIIGVVSEEINSTTVPEAKSYVFASYVKFLESAGARVVPIWIYKSINYYEDIMSKINGVLFPGGDDLLQSKGFGRTGKIIFDIATKMNDKGDYFPLWGTCLGFELLNYLAKNKLWMKTCDAEDVSSNIEFVKGFEKSRMFQDIDRSLANIMKSQTVVVHYHHWCITPKNFTLSGLDKYFKVLALNQDARNLTFVSIVEAFNYPFYGVTFHPEKVVFEWKIFKSQEHIPHNSDAIHVSQYFANFFVDEARKSGHHFSNKTEENAALIYNYQPVFTGQYENNTSEQTYYFTQ